MRSPNHDYGTCNHHIDGKPCPGCDLCLPFRTTAEPTGDADPDGQCGHSSTLEGGVKPCPTCGSVNPNECQNDCLNGPSAPEVVCTCPPDGMNPYCRVHWPSRPEGRSG